MKPYLHIVEITQSHRLLRRHTSPSLIYTQQKLLSHIDYELLPDEKLIYTQQKLLSHIDISHLPTNASDLHIVEITQSYRLRYSTTPLNSHLHIVEITQSYRHYRFHSQNRIIYTQQKLLSHIDISSLKEHFIHLHIVEITQSYRHLDGL